jgi:hypothetical protein
LLLVSSRALCPGSIAQRVPYGRRRWVGRCQKQAGGARCTMGPGHEARDDTSVVRQCRDAAGSAYCVAEDGRELRYGRSRDGLFWFLVRPRERAVCTVSNGPIRDFRSRVDENAVSEKSALRYSRCTTNNPWGKQRGNCSCELVPQMANVPINYASLPTNVKW